MNKRLKYWIKRLSPVALTKNHRYDMLATRILKKYCRPDSNCVDVGAHQGEFLRSFLRFAPQGTHFAFEPLPYFFNRLNTRFAKYSNCKIYNYALSNSEGLSPFNYVVTNPAYSGIRKRTYDRKIEKDKIINVYRKRLDDIIPARQSIDFIKIDVEGGEYDVMEGAQKILNTWNPLVLFEFGMGGSDAYGITPEKMYEFLDRLGYRISLLDDFLEHRPSLSNQDFNRQVYGKVNYYFIGHSSNKPQLL